MKKILLFSSMLIVIACSKSPNEKAQATVESFLSRNLHDPSSYQEVEWSELDSTTTLFTESNTYKSILKERDYLADLSERQESSGTKRTIYLATREKADSLTQVLYTLNKDYVGKLNGYRIILTYRAKNAMGAIILDRDTFYLNINLDSVLSMNS